MKYILFSSLLNIISLVLLFTACLLNFKRVRLSLSELIATLCLFLFLLMQLFSSFHSDAIFEPLDLLKYTSLIMIVALVTCVGKLVSLKRLQFYIISWTNILVLLYLIKVITPNKAGELSYLILSMQLGIGFCVSLSLSLLNNKINYIYLVNSIVILLCILSLAGRTAIIGSVLVFLFVLIIYIKINIKYNFINVIWLLLLIGLFVSFTWGYVTDKLLNEYFVYKIKKTITTGDQRFDVYLDSLELIRNNLFGLGLQRYNIELGFYPHNIFIESILNAGVLSGLFLFVFFSIWFCRYLKYSFLYKNISVFVISQGLIAGFLFLSWNTSNNLTSSYVPFVGMMISLLQVPSRKASL